MKVKSSERLTYYAYTLAQTQRTTLHCREDFLFLLEEFKELSDEHFHCELCLLYYVCKFPLYFVFGLETFRVLCVLPLPYFVFGI